MVRIPSGAWRVGGAGSLENRDRRQERETGETQWARLAQFGAVSGVRESGPAGAGYWERDWPGNELASDLYTDT